MSEITWVTCDGGPHLLLPAECVSLWQGSSGWGCAQLSGAPSHRELTVPETDYDIACAIDELVGVIKVGPNTALVLGDEVPMSTWIPSRLFTGGVLVVPMTWAGPGTRGEALLAVINGLRRSDFVSTGLILPASSGSFVLCSAADAEPHWIAPKLSLTMPATTYQVLSAEVRRAGFWLRLHALDADSSQYSTVKDA